MSSYKSQFSNPNPPRADNPNTASQRTTTTTRLPTRKNVPTQSPETVPIHASPSKLTKRRPVQGTDNAAASRGAQKPKGGVPKVPTSRDTRKQTTPGSGITLSEGPQSRSMLAAVSTRTARIDPPFARTPSLVSGSSASTTDSPRSNVLRRKQSSVGRKSSKSQKGSLGPHEDTAVMETLNVLSDPFPDSVLGFALPASSTGTQQEQIYGSVPFNSFLDYANPNPAAVNLTPPTPHYALSATPSTGYSASPGPFSISSTPTSMSSYSPATTTLTNKPLPRLTQPSPTKTRPVMTRRRPSDAEDKGLSSVRESSSSSGSTVRNGESTWKKDKVKLDPMPAPPPSPPYQPSNNDDRKAEKLVRSPRQNTAVPPPELAHLMDAKPLPKFPPASRPVRPSREGTPEYIDLRGPSPIIQSNLSSLPSSLHRRQNSSDSRTTGISATSASSKARFAPGSRVPSAQPSPSPSQISTFSRTTSRAPTTRGATPEISSDTEANSKNGYPSSSSKSGSRFAFFRRKTEPLPPTASGEKRLRKGPAAGTGHEGYGKYALTRGRSGSTTSGASASSRSPSADSDTGSFSRIPASRKSSFGSKGSPAVDDFLLQRLNPVTLRGEGPSSQERPSRERRPSETSSHASSDSKRPTGLRPAASRPAQRGESPVKRDRSVTPTTQNSSRFGIKALGGRRLSRMSMAIDGKPSATSTSPNKGSSGAPSAHVGSSKTWQSSTSTDNAMRADMAPRSSTHPQPRPQGKLSRKWNFFQRAHGTPKNEAPPAVVAAPAQPYQSSTRSMAHYALMEGRQKVGLDELEQIMQEANESPDEEDTYLNQGVNTSPAAKLPLESRNNADISFLRDPSPPRDEDEVPIKSEPPRSRSILLPERPFLPPALKQPARAPSPVVQLRRQSPERYELPPVEPSSPITTTVLGVPEPLEKPQASPLVAMPPQRPSRLQQVGRIPQVRRDRERKLSMTSFSRPFGSDGSPVLQQQSPQIGSQSPKPDDRLPPKAPLLTDMATQFGAQHSSFAQEVDAAFNSRRASTQTATTIDPTGIDDGDEFLTFPPRNGSDFSASTSSAHPSFKTMLVTAPAFAPVATPPMEDEVWGEYDDLIDEVLSPSQSKDGKSSRRQDSTTEPSGKRLSVAPLNLSRRRRPSDAPAAPPSQPGPSSTYSISDFLGAYGSRGVSMATTIDATTSRLSTQPAANDQDGMTPLGFPSSALPEFQPSVSQPSTDSQPPTSRPTTVSSSPSTSPKQGQSNDPRAALAMTFPTAPPDEIKRASASLDEDEGLASMANLRFGALMTSKWLSFGRVLFSPVHHELKDPSEDRVLIVDGLGKDWSYYVALTYPQASVYSLGPDPSAFPSSQPTSPNGSFQSMPNHRHIQHPMLSAPFPFPKGFFAAVVFRFPTVSSESAYRTAVHECKRVLRPGGYLEISVLDIDLVNMGNCARKAVRGLKMRMAERSPDLCLRPVSDVLMRLLGRRGFEGMQRCVVGVPAAGPLKLSGDSTSAAAPQGVKSSLEAPAQGGERQAKTTLSFTDLLRTDHDSPADTRNITRMVARIGRWWYEQCYEPAVPSTGPPAASNRAGSIWRDAALLSECEKRGTTFRLLICYAQKPTAAVRRTVSV